MINKIKFNNYKISLVEVEAVLNCLNDEDYSKIPEEIIEAIETNKDENHLYEYDENLDFKDWNLMSETKAILYNLFKKYLATEEQRKYFEEKEKLETMRLEREKREKYSSNVVFKKKEENNEIKSLIKTKEEKWYNKIFNTIKKLFKQ